MTDNQQKKIFTRNLNRLLKKSGKTQKEVANDLNLNPQTVNSWCTGAALPRMGKIQLLSDYFGVLKSELIEDNPESDNPESEIMAITDPEDAVMFHNYASLDDEQKRLIRDIIAGQKALKDKED